MYMKLYEVTFGMRLYLGMFLFMGKYSIGKILVNTKSSHITQISVWHETCIHNWHGNVLDTEEQ